jgi:hypothetical protein
METKTKYRVVFYMNTEEEVKNLIYGVVSPINYLCKVVRYEKEQETDGANNKRTGETR